MNNNKNLKSFVKGIMYIAPAFVLLLIFNIYPIIKSFDMSFYTRYNYYKDIVYARGLHNFYYIFSDKEFLIAMKNTFIYVLYVMPISIILSLIIAILLNLNIKFRGFFRTVYFIPFITSTVAISMVWRWMYHADHGIINYLLRIIGLSPVKWLSDPKWAMPSLIILSVWKSLGYNIVIFLAGLQNIDEQYNLAAKLDGANKWGRIKNITVPLLSPTIFFVCIMTLISSFKVFGEIFALFDKQPGPLNTCLTMVYYIYNKFYNQYQYGIASAAVFVLFIIISLFNFIQFYIGKKKVEYH
ncbi:sugar ABC transporter permease [Clostridium botulinum]|uniref:carbohydrate ABC transporter permease n=1 Tax=Clostridium botulinum TaxID=1491 RepID=UPI001A92D3F1|nr:sugar ABC transporter permease [Clostridium botulinum]MBO0524079.1 sugar ABC transporter permease [Clostridium botulinum]MBO0535831.1 sugar ABC transporter permease [Clostridium botulinum]MBO0540708.1 sugar ABC transporter permease [Clostridium botulinum]MBO0541183.1 sugar ABC transporter permease [Clostridium botulinum]MBO0547075.1 sugar ABC transporter permease [Clostridium botulinum]